MQRTAPRSGQRREQVWVRLLERDTELGRSLSHPHFERAASTCVARVVRVPRGVLQGWPLLEEPEEGFQGFLVLSGALSHRVTMGQRHSAELLGPGDLLRPWGTSAAITPVSARWRVHGEAEVAILDRGFHDRAAQWPELASGLLDRAALRSGALVTQMLIAQTARMTDRILLLLSHLADRWGLVRTDGVLLPLRLSRALIAELAGATRESTSRALTALASQGLVETTDRGFLLRASLRPRWS